MLGKSYRCQGATIGSRKIQEFRGFPFSAFRSCYTIHFARSLLSATPPVATRNPLHAYSVPKRFGLGAIMAFTTLFAVLLGILRMYDAPVGFYIFFGVMGCAVCAAQMITNQVPRLVSVLVGAICLPLTAVVYAVMGEVPGSEAVVMVPCLAVPGAIIGYLTGTMAAGVFLMGDMLEARVRGETIATAELVEEPIATDGIPTFTPDSCTPFIGDAASQLSSGEAVMNGDDTPRVKSLGPPESVPVYNCLALVAPRDAHGIVHVRAANLSDLRTSGTTEREALQHLVGAFKIIISQCLAEGRDVPLLKEPHPPQPGEQQRYIAVHL